MTTKITVSLPDAAVVAAKKAVSDGRTSSVSAYIAAALEHTYGRRPLAGVVADMIAETGEPTAEDIAWANEALGIA
jgi:Arc/MetJ-type ribon-helix-helix transcriptional regulator